MPPTTEERGNLRTEERGNLRTEKSNHESTSAFVSMGMGAISWAIDSARGAPNCLFSKGNGAGSFRHWQTMVVIPCRRKAALQSLTSQTLSRMFKGCGLAGPVGSPAAEVKTAFDYRPT